MKIETPTRVAMDRATLIDLAKTAIGIALVAAGVWLMLCADV